MRILQTFSNFCSALFIALVRRKQKPNAKANESHNSLKDRFFRNGAYADLDKHDIFQVSFTVQKFRF